MIRPGRRQFLATCGAAMGTATLPSWTNLLAADAPAKPVEKITPGKAIVPGGAGMRRPWGELISLDLNTRTGKFRRETTEEIVSFTVLPYAELLHHAAFGDLQDFRVGERAIFRLHEDDRGEWTWLTYIQDEMNFLFNHKEYYHVQKIDPAARKFEAIDATADKSFAREGTLAYEVDDETRYWKQGQPASFADIRVGDKLRTKSHGRGKGTTRVCWEVFLDDASLLKFQAEQQAVHKRRMTEDGLPGYVDASEGRSMQVTLFRECGPMISQLKPGQAVRLAPAGVDRRATGASVDAKLLGTKPAGGATTQAKLELSAPSDALVPAGLMRMWAS